SWSLWRWPCPWLGAKAETTFHRLLLRLRNPRLHLHRRRRLRRRRRGTARQAETYWTTWRLHATLPHPSQRRPQPVHPHSPRAQRQAPPPKVPTRLPTSPPTPRRKESSSA